MRDSFMFIPKTPRIDTHKASILYRLLLGHRIKNKEMWTHIDTGYAASRISELRSDLWPIDDKSLQEVTKEKKNVIVKQYFIKNINLSEILKDQNIQTFIEKYQKYWTKRAG